MARRAVARVNLGAVERNCARLREELRRGTELCAVVKADGYGHGAIPVAQAALQGGATWLAVAAAGEAAELRAAGVEARLLVMGALSDSELATAVEAEADVVAWREEFVDRLTARAKSGREVRVHVKLDSGMGRLGTRDAAEADRVADAVARSAGLKLAGAMTHLATADEDDDAFLREQLERFTPWAGELKRRFPDIVLHAANSAATLREPDSHFDLVRCGIAVYGLDPFQDDPASRGLEPALELRSWVADVKPYAAGESAGYGRSFVATEPTCLAVLPIGYGDGVRRALSNNAEVLIGGRRHPVRGTISMDNLTVEVGRDPSVAAGDEAVLIGVSNGERLLAEEVARRLGTINYEITCGLSPRVLREHHRDGAPA